MTYNLRGPLFNKETLSMLSFSTFTQKTIMYIWEMICFAVITLSRLNVQHHYRQTYRLYVLFSLFVYCLLYVECTYVISMYFIHVWKCANVSWLYAGPQSFYCTAFNIKATLFFHLFLWMFSSEAMHLVFKRFSNKSLYTVLQSSWQSHMV